MFCRSCGTMIPDDSNFCPKCGIKVVVPKQDSPRQAVQRTSYARSHQNIQADKRAEQSHKVDGQLFREIAMLVGGLVVVWIGNAMWIGSTLSRYFSAKTSAYQAEFGQSAPDAIQWMMGIGGFLINVAGAICLYIAVCPIAQRFGAWRKQNKIIGTILAVVICLIVFVCFSLKTSVTGSFGVWDYLIMAAIFGGMWKGGSQKAEQHKDKSACKSSDSLEVKNIVVGRIDLGSRKEKKSRTPRKGLWAIGFIVTVALIILVCSRMSSYDKNQNHLAIERRKEYVAKTIEPPKNEKEFKGMVKHKVREEVRQTSVNREDRIGQGHEINLQEDLGKLSDAELDTRMARLYRKYSGTTLDYSKWSDEDLLLANRISSEQRKRPTRNKIDEQSSRVTPVIDKRLEDMTDEELRAAIAAEEARLGLVKQENPTVPKWHSANQ